MMINLGKLDELETTVHKYCLLLCYFAQTELVDGDEDDLVIMINIKLCLGLIESKE